MGTLLDTLLGKSKAPQVTDTPVIQTEEEKKKAKKSRAQVIATRAGVAGEELSVGQVSGGTTIFGN